MIIVTQTPAHLHRLADSTLAVTDTTTANSLRTAEVDASLVLAMTDSATTTGVTYKGVDFGVGTSTTIPTHSVNNIIVIFAFTSTTTTPPTKPTASGTVPAWNIAYNTTGTNGSSLTIAYFAATATNTTSGTWSGAQAVTAVVLSGQGSTPTGGVGVTFATVSSIVAPAVTMTNSDGTSALLQFYSNGTGGTWNAAPGGYTHRQSASNSPCVNTKDDTTSDGSVTQVCSTSAKSVGAQLEITAH